MASRKTSPSRSNKKHASEESGWSFYFDDFAPANVEDDMGSSSSLVSDASWHGFNGNSTAKSKNLPSKSQRKSRPKKHLCDIGDLEDTAISPLNSPKVSSMKMQMEASYRRTDDSNFGHFRGNGEASESVVDGSEHDYSDLKKRGLCLVPVSSFMNYIG